MRPKSAIQVAVSICKKSGTVRPRRGNGDNGVVLRLSAFGGDNLIVAAPMSS
jgi:hypothetical protein